MSMIKQVVDFMVCVYAFFNNASPINASSQYCLEDENKNYNDFVGNDSSYYYDEEACQTFPNQSNIDLENVPYGGNYSCAACGKDLHYNYQVTYACNGREFCSTLCRKRFSDEDLKNIMVVERAIAREIRI